MEAHDPDQSWAGIAHDPDELCAVPYVIPSMESALGAGIWRQLPTILLK